ncbi:MAG TPA: hypothetical protein VGN36_09775 [Sphingorhabdus sp.]|jgi:hypothetical protein|nr:hypothetical protein [Sphingorhabdus sp.]
MGVPEIPNYKAVVGYLSRRAVLAAMFAMSSSVASKPRKRKVSRVLFVCQAGTVKSPIARELFRKKAAERGLEIQALSRGIAVEDHVTHELRKKLIADRIDARSEPAQQLSTADLKLADIVVVFNPLLAESGVADIRDWTDVPSVINDYDNALAVINKRLDALLDALEEDLAVWK